MNHDPRVEPPQTTSRRARIGRRLLGLGVVAVPLLIGAGACLDRPIASSEPNTSNTFAEELSIQTVDKIDILFSIDNSTSMADKQTVLAAAVPQLLNRLINPLCVDPKDPDNKQNATLTASSGGKCADPTKALEFNAINDIHVAVVSSSLGSHGSDSCTKSGMANDPSNDNAHLLSRGLASGETITMNGSTGEFLAWYPTGTSPDNNAYNDSAKIDTAFKDLVLGVGQNGCGYECQLESWYRFLVDPNPPVIEQESIKISHGNEATPAAYAKVSSTPDKTILTQRADFLRPDSLVAIVLLSDENDSCTADGQFPRGVRRAQDAQTAGGQVQAWSDVNSDPTRPGTKYVVDPCANGYGLANDAPKEFCGQNSGFSSIALATQYSNGNSSASYHPPMGNAKCKDDPWSAECFPDTKSQFNDTPRGDAMLAALDANTQIDGANNRFFNPKGRFGVTTQYPVQRYIDAIKYPTVFDTSGATMDTPPSTAYYASNTAGGQRVALEVTNPLFDDLQAAKFHRAKMKPRDPSLIFFAGIVGVPWQDIAVDPTNLKKGYRTASTIAADPKFGWSFILGADPYSSDVKQRRAGDPLMVESIADRTTLTPSLNKTLITGETIQGVGGTWDKIHGHEWNIVSAADQGNDLQYACIFKLPQARTDMLPKGNECLNSLACDCAPSTDPAIAMSDNNDVRKNPLCEIADANNMGTGQYNKYMASGTTESPDATSTQPFAKAYPGLRYLEVLKGIGDQAIVASICPANLDGDGNAPDYGYNPAVTAIIERLKAQLTGGCTPRSLDVNSNGAAPCLIIQTACPINTVETSSGTPMKTHSCTADQVAQAAQCNGAGLTKLPADIAADLTGDVVDNFDVRCQMKQLDNNNDKACATNISSLPADCQQAQCQTQATVGTDVHGWCYIDPTFSTDAATVAAEKVQLGPSCQHTIRFAHPSDVNNASLFITCLGAAAGTRPDQTSSGGGAGAAGAASTTGGAGGQLARTQSIPRSKIGVSIQAPWQAANR